MFFRTISDNHPYAKMQRAVSTPSLSENEIFDLIHSAACDMLEEAEKLSLGGDIWHIFTALSLARDDNPLGLAAESPCEPKGSLIQVAAYELTSVYKTITSARKIAESCRVSGWLDALSNYEPSGGNTGVSQPVRKEAVEAILEFAEFAREVTRSPDTSYDLKWGKELCRALIDFYRKFGSGLFSLGSAFRWSADAKKLHPIGALDPITFADLVGYESQKHELRSNTELFLDRKPANNVLLYGDSGTGKSSSVRALLNEPGYTSRGLRIIELHKGQFQDIPLILDTIGKRNYRFIIFMDDLSFEEFEVDYKYLKALIEGGIERKPENLLIYATSNRRNLVREVWADRKKASDDVHGADTMQEKLSLADRFGVTIWYGSCNKNEYMDIVEHLTAENGIHMPPEDLSRRALRWEITHGGFTGRTAKQFVKYLLAETAGKNRREESL